MTPPPRRALVFHICGVEFVVRPAAWVLFGSIAAALDISYFPLALPAQNGLHYHVLAIATVCLMVIAVLVHESGHALVYRLQGSWPVRITLRGMGGACAAVVNDDAPGRALGRALGGPAATALVVVGLALAWHSAALPESARLVAATLFVFGFFDLVFNTLPVHPRSDGTFALRAMLWLVQKRQPENFAVLYLWRPVILALVMFVVTRGADSFGYLTQTALVILTGLVLVLCAIPPLAIARRRWTHAYTRLPSR